MYNKNDCLDITIYNKYIVINKIINKKNIKIM